MTARPALRFPLDTPTPAEPPGQLELYPSAPAGDCTSYRVVSIDSASGCEAAPTGIPQWSPSIRDLPIAAARAAAAAVTYGKAWIQGADLTSCEISDAGAVTPRTGWAKSVARVLDNRKEPSMPTQPETLDLSAGPVLLNIELDKIVDHPHNIRVDLGDLTDLARSLIDVGVLVPVTVRPHPTRPGFFELGDGHRRRGAAVLAGGIDSLPCLVGDHTDAQMIEMMLTTGIQRRDISPVEEARGYTYLVELDTSIADIARKMGHTQKYVKGRLALLRLPSAVLDLVHAGNLTLGNAEELIDYADDDEAMAWVVQARTGVESPWGSAANAVANHIDQRDEQEALAVAVANLEAAGIARFARPNNWWPPYHLKIDRPAGLDLLKLTGAQNSEHVGEPCHAVHLKVERRWNEQTKDRDIIEVDHLEICTDPARHTTTVDEADRSPIQLDPEQYTTPSTGAVTASAGNRPDPVTEAAEISAAARRAFVATIARTATPPPVDRLHALASLWEVAQGDEASDILDLLEVGVPVDNWHARRVAFERLAADETNWSRILFVMSLLRAEYEASLLNPHAQAAITAISSDHHYIRSYLATLEDLGYELSDYEQQGIDGLDQIETEVARRALEEEDPTSDVAAARLFALTADCLITLEALLTHEAMFGTDPLAPGGVYTEDVHLTELIDTHFVSATVDDDGITCALTDFARKVKTVADASFDGGFAGFAEDAAIRAGATS